MGLGFPLVGRDAELALVSSIVGDGSRAGTGVVLSGAAGVGKSRLAREVVARLTEVGRPVETIVATRATQPVPFGAVAHLVPRDMAASRLDLLQRIGDALVAGRAPAPVVFADDAHLLDDSTASLLHQLAARHEIAVLATVRTREPLPAGVEALWKDDLAERVEMQPLARSEASALVAAALDGPVDGATQHRLWQWSQGNPLLLREVLTAGTEGGALVEAGGVWTWRFAWTPAARLLEVVDRRLAGLEPPERHAVELLAVGEPLPVDVFVDLTGAAIADRLERRGLVETTDNGTQVRLAHPLYADVLRDQLPAATGRAIRRRLVAALEQAGSTDVLRLATWRLEAGDRSSPAVLVEAARRATSVYEHAVAERLAAAAIEAGGGGEAELVLATSLFWQGRHDEALTRLEAISPDGLDPDQQAALAIQHGSSLFWGGGRGEDADALLGGRAQRLGDHPGASEVRGHAATIRLFARGPAAALAVGVPVLEDPAASPRARVRAATAVAPALVLGLRSEHGTSVVTDALPLAFTLADELPLASGQLAVTQCLAHWVSCRLPEAEAIAESLYSAAAARRVDDLRGAWALALGRIAMSRGRVATAARHLREAAMLLRADDAGGFLPWALALLAQALTLSGDPDEAARTHAEARARIDLAVLFAVEVDLAEAWIAAALGEATRAAECAARAGEQALGSGHLLGAALAFHDVARLGFPERVVTPLAALAAADEGPLAGAFASHAAAAARGDGDGLDTAARTFESLRLDLLASEAAAEAHRVHARDGRRAASLASATTARRLEAACEGARTPALRYAETGDAAETLTRREREVAILAAQGLTNREIASRLVVSLRTVDNHLVRTFAKLGVNSRTQLADVLGGSPVA